MRIRTIKPEFFKHEGLAELAPLERLLFVGLWCMADANGVLPYRPKRIKIEVLPYDDLDVSQAIPRLVSGDYLRTYRVDGEDFLQVVNWHRHQRIQGKEREHGARYPLPPGDLEKKKRSGNDGETPETHPVAQERKGKDKAEGEGAEKEQGNTRETTAAAPAASPVKLDMGTILNRCLVKTDNDREAFEGMLRHVDHALIDSAIRIAKRRLEKSFGPRTRPYHSEVLDALGEAKRRRDSTNGGR